MKLKKTLSVLLTTALIFTLIAAPTPGSAEVADPASTGVIGVDDKDGSNTWETTGGLSDLTFASYDMFGGDEVGNLPEGWSSQGASAAVSSVSGTEIYCLDISATADNAVVSRGFDAVDGRVMVSFDLRTESQLGASVTVSSSKGKTAAKLDLSQNKLTIADTDVNVTFNKGFWYNIRLSLDTDAGKYDLFVDGVRQIRDADFAEECDDIAKVSFRSANGGRLMIDHLAVYAQTLQSAPGTLFNVRDYGAVGDGVTDDTAAIQSAIDACTKGGSVVLENGVFHSKTIKLKGNMTFWIDRTATLLGSDNASDYPALTGTTLTANHNQKDVNRALIYADTVDGLRVDGGGTVDCNGNGFTTGKENTRPSALFFIGCTNLTVSNINIENSGMWTMPIMSSDNVYIRDVTMRCTVVQNRDGIDVCDCGNVLIEWCSMKTDDDVICLKSGEDRGISDVLVRNCMVSSTRANGIKLGTLSVGPVSNVHVFDCLVKDVKIGGLNVEAVDGSDVSGFDFDRILMQNCALPFYVVLSDRAEKTGPSATSVGSIDGVVFQNIVGDHFTSNAGCYVSGLKKNNVTYRLRNISFINCVVDFKGGVTVKPNSPREFTTGYPESLSHGTLPAYGVYLRHINGAVVDNCTFTVDSNDVRNAVSYGDDVLYFGGVAGEEPADEALPENLALHCTATSKFVGGDTPSRAVDGDSGTRWGTPTSGPATDNDTGETLTGNDYTAARPTQWLTVDLGSQKTFNAVMIDWETAYAKEYKIQVSDDGTNFTDVAHVEASGGGQETVNFESVKARYVRMQGIKEATAWGYSIFEFGVYCFGGTPSEPGDEPGEEIDEDEIVNLALNRPASSKFENADAPSRAVDGTTSGNNTRWGTPTRGPVTDNETGNSLTGDDYTAARPTQWLQVDLGEGATFNKVVIYWEASYAKEYKIQVSDDGTNFTDVAHVENGSGGTATITFDTVTARYIRMQGIKERGNGYGYSIYEFEVYGQIKTPAVPGDVDGDENVGATDLTILARHVGQIEAITDKKLLKNADLDGDGSVGATDLTILARKVAQID